jgi:hypothetical protein
MFSLEGAGSLLSGISSVAGAFGGGQSKISALNLLKDQYHINRHYNLYPTALELPSKQVEGFKKAGIHPLYGMGGGGALNAQSPSLVMPDTKNTDFARMGQGLDRALSAGQTRNTQRMIEEGAQLDLQRKRLENKHLETQITASQLAVSRTAGVPAISGNPRSSGNIDGVVEHLASPQESAAINSNGGVAAGTPPMYKRYIGRNGLPIYGPSAQNSGEAMEGWGGLVMIPQMIFDEIYGFVKRPIVKTKRYINQFRK